MEVLANLAHIALFAQFDDFQQQAIFDLAEIFESAITKPALPIVIRPNPAVLTVPPPSPRLTLPIIAPLQPAVLKFPPPYPRVTFPPISPRVPFPVQPNFIDPDYNGDNINAVAAPRYHLRLHRRHRPLAKQEPHHIAANTSAIA